MNKEELAEVVEAVMEKIMEGLRHDAKEWEKSIIDEQL